MKYTLIYHIDKGAFVTGLKAVARASVLPDQLDRVIIDTTVERDPRRAIKAPFYAEYTVAQSDDPDAVLAAFDQHARMLFKDSVFAYESKELALVDYESSQFGEDSSAQSDEDLCR